MLIPMSMYSLIVGESNTRFSDSQNEKNSSWYPLVKEETLNPTTKEWENGQTNRLMMTKRLLSRWHGDLSLSFSSQRD